MRPISFGVIAIALTLAACGSEAEKTDTAVAATPQAATPAAPAAAESPLDHVRALYASLGDADFSSLTDEAGPRIYSKETWALYQAVNARVPEGEIGPIEVEPLCWCQDNTGLAIRTVQMGPGETAGADAAEGSMAEVNATLTSDQGIIIILIKEDGVWKVRDAGPEGDPGLLSLLQDAA